MATPGLLPERDRATPQRSSFNPSTRLTLSLPEASTVTATVFNALGQPVGTFRSGEAMSAATHDAGEISCQLSAVSYPLTVTTRSGHRRLLNVKKPGSARCRSGLLVVS